MQPIRDTTHHHASNPFRALKPPSNFCRICRPYTGQSKGVKSRRAVVEKKKIGPCVFRVAGMNSLVLAVMNPDAVKNDRHPWHLCRQAQLVSRGVPTPIHRYPGEGPFLRVAGRAIDAVPTIDVELTPRAFRRIRPGLCSFRIVPGYGIERIHVGTAGRTSENRLARAGLASNPSSSCQLRLQQYRLDC